MSMSDRKPVCAARSGGRIAAVIATYNRKELLLRCLNAVLAQTRPVDRVIVVDNCSTDGTAEFLAERGYLGNRLLDYVRLTENGGSAGGFHAGMKRAYEQGFDWLWVMDDDCVSLPDTLAHLLECPERILFRGCVILNIEDPDREQVAFGLKSPSGVVHNVREISGLGGAEGVLEGYACPFNGALLSSLVVRRIGLPKKEMFIWGDEIEYLLRAGKFGVPVGTVLAARLLHPLSRSHEKMIRLGSLCFGFTYSNDPLRFYLIVRNYTYIALRYRGPFSKGFVKMMAYPIFFPWRAGIALRALRDGVLGKFPPAEQVRGVAPAKG
jgi:rhamnopyranosyl-N-acetylglucosaminyl-diphospho-decaprenol beta-1,3/1,4-galactofuranosyltransferase